MSSPKTEAARWFVRMQDAEPDSPLRGQFETWLMSNPAHAQAFGAISHLWDQLESNTGLAALAGMLDQDKMQRDQRRRVLKRGLLGLFLFSGTAGLAYRQWQDWPLLQFAEFSGVGKVRRFSLDDGSELTLGAASSIEVHYSRGERSVALLAGEALFDVARDEQRPFVIDSGVARITVLGTRFVVSRWDASVRVSVERGRVEVASGPFWRRQRLELAAGEVAEVVATGQQPALQRVARDASDAFSFTQGSLSFSNASLGEMAVTLSRYRRQPVQVSPGAEHAPPITAVVQTRDVEGFLHSLPLVHPVVVAERDGVTWLGAAGR